LNNVNGANTVIRPQVCPVSRPVPGEKDNGSPRAQSPARQDIVALEPNREEHVIMLQDRIEALEQENTNLRDKVRVAPEAYCCPITYEVMKDPVILRDGHTYERESIATWFGNGHNTSPLTGKRLPSRQLIPNVTLKKAIDEWRETSQKE